MLFASCGLMFSRLLPKVARKHIIWVILYAVFAASFNITNYLSINYIAVGTASKEFHLQSFTITPQEVQKFLTLSRAHN